MRFGTAPALTLTAMATLTALTAGMPPAARAQTEPPSAFALSGGATLTSDYRYRGISRSDRDAAVQGTLAVEHESGLYATLWASTIKGWIARGGADAEIALTAGYALSAGALTLDAGTTVIAFPGGRGDSTIVQPFATVRGDLGPAGLKLGIAYAPKQRALGTVAPPGTDAPSRRRGDNLYLWGDLTSGLPGTPVTLKGHLGYSDGRSGLGPGGIALTPTGAYLDWKLGAEIAAGPVTLGLAYSDTDISRRQAAAVPGFAERGTGASPADGRLTLSATLGF